MTIGEGRTVGLSPFFLLLRLLAGLAVGAFSGAALARLSVLPAGQAWGKLGYLSLFDLVVVSPLAVLCGCAVALVRGGRGWVSAVAAACSAGAGFAWSLRYASPFSELAESFSDYGRYLWEDGVFYAFFLGLLAFAGAWIAGRGEPGRPRLATGLAAGALAAGASLPLSQGAVLLLLGAEYRDRPNTVLALVVALVAAGGVAAALLAGRPEGRAAALSAVCGVAAFSFAAGEIDPRSESTLPHLVLFLVLAAALIAGLGGWMVGRARRWRRERR